MRRIAVCLSASLVFLLALAVPSVTHAQTCNSGSASEAGSAEIGDCDGINPYQTILTTQTYAMSSQVTCRNNSYTTEIFGGSQESVSANGQCGHFTLDPPLCPGEVGPVGTSTPGSNAVSFLVTYYHRTWNSSTGCQPGEAQYTSIDTPSEGCNGSYCCGGAAANICGHSGGDFASCQCYFSPIIINLEGEQTHLTGPLGGVPFDLKPDGHREQVSWTSATSADAFLVLDRDGNGSIDDGRELFGSVTEQPPTDHRNGFNALSVFDRNRDERIDLTDPVYRRLRLWRDANHNGLSESNELRGLADAGILEIGLDYRVTSRQDRHGNRFRYVARIKQHIDGRIVWRLAYDVFLVGF